MPRRRRISDDGLDLPRHLLPAAVAADPVAWRAARFEWSRAHDWGPQKLGLLAFFDETVILYRSALGFPVRGGSAERWARRLEESR